MIHPPLNHRTDPSSNPTLPERSRRRRRITAVVFVALAAMVLPALALGPWMAPEEALGMPNPVAASKGVLAKGRELYADRCADCHGRKGRGDGSGGADLERRPTDLTASKVQSQTDGALFWKITEGRRPMPAYGRKLSEEQRWQVVHYLRSFASKSNPKPADRQPPAQNQKQP